MTVKTRRKLLLYTQRARISKKKKKKYEIFIECVIERLSKTS